MSESLVKIIFSAVLAAVSISALLSTSPDGFDKSVIIVGLSFAVVVGIAIDVGKALRF